MNLHDSPTDGIYRLFEDGDCFEMRDPVAGELLYQITHLGERAYLQSIRGHIDKDGRKKIFASMAAKGVKIVEYHHHGKLFTHDIETGKTKCQRVDCDEITYDDFAPGMSDKCKACKAER